ncbi:MAG: preprotein translocase subunit SecG [gamma proteobacterium symbiont of Bathyaustriella thionipta]|nr:preprotein translocase subunit SecG [gamma proteobacterium symbiont of Bathyaustriella thionipta]MCU7948853.1 preprotein translocase subunit SecG [gamma proteobacterium symbiont of Bathyaustriella thionipta]MCU7951938.1 preprotein translocase subunit SecG [gamma proteobacterium symbiont of Bathyaustriella thionipta]MCU7955427.1 preprotein translocase subunit SecG [gamma proteobacterium symbiont of Bathyaustriella thionipta]MCU7965756.1 preprotein translocase subunit SecG [gamma proteobacteri
MEAVILAVHIVIAITLIGLILIQQGKGADAGAAFGGGGGGGASSTVFGSQGSGNFLSKSTAILATVFFVTSLFLSYLSGQVSAEKTEAVDVLNRVEQIQSEDKPAVPVSANTPAETTDKPALPDE